MRRWATPLFLLLLPFSPFSLSSLAGCGRPGATPPTCAAGRVALQGACVEPLVADRFCGKSGVFVDGACTARACPDAQVLDLATGECLGVRALREIGARVHVVFEDGQTLGCRDGTLLHVANGHPMCVEREKAKPLSAAKKACGAGEVHDEALDRCVLVASDGAVDVAAWTRAVLGADGGPAAPELCARIGLDPSALGLGITAHPVALVTAELVFPNNDVTQVHARTLAQDDGGHPLLPPGTSIVADAVDVSVDALRGLGGTASAASVSVRVRCAISTGFQPIAVDPAH